MWCFDAFCMGYSSPIQIVTLSYKTHVYDAPLIYNMRLYGFITGGKNGRGVFPPRVETRMLSYLSVSHLSHQFRKKCSAITSTGIESSKFNVSFMNLNSTGCELIALGSWMTQHFVIAQFFLWKQPEWWRYSNRKGNGFLQNTLSKRLLYHSDFQNCTKRSSWHVKKLHRVQVMKLLYDLLAIPYIVQTKFHSHQSNSHQPYPPKNMAIFLGCRIPYPHTPLKKILTKLKAFDSETETISSASPLRKRQSDRKQPMNWLLKNQLNRSLDIFSPNISWRRFFYKHLSLDIQTPEVLYLDPKTIP